MFYLSCAFQILEINPESVPGVQTVECEGTRRSDLSKSSSRSGFNLGDGGNSQLICWNAIIRFVVVLMR